MALLCADGAVCCRFDLRTDPLERFDQARAHPGKVAHMNVRLAVWEATAYNPHRGSDNGAACEAAANTWNGFWGPWLP